MAHILNVFFLNFVGLPNLNCNVAMNIKQCQEKFATIQAAKKNKTIMILH